MFGFDFCSILYKTAWSVVSVASRREDGCPASFLGVAESGQNPQKLKRSQITGAGIAKLSPGAMCKNVRGAITRF
jgi:hypothetical protein